MDVLVWYVKDFYKGIIQEVSLLDLYSVMVFAVGNTYSTWRLISLFALSQRHQCYCDISFSVDHPDFLCLSLPHYSDDCGHFTFCDLKPDNRVCDHGGHYRAYGTYVCIYVYAISLLSQC